MTQQIESGDMSPALSAAPPVTPPVPGYKTTEFWLTLAATLVAASLAYLDKIDAPWAVVTVAILNGLYAVLRTATKHNYVQVAARLQSLLLLAGLGCLSLPLFGCAQWQAFEDAVPVTFRVDHEETGSWVGYSSKGGIGAGIVLKEKDRIKASPRGVIEVVPEK